jgi:predicted alpha/beta-fold hydrolase
MTSDEQSPSAPTHESPWWLGRGTFGAHAQTVYPAVFGRTPSLAYKRERWDSTPFGKPDGDFVDVDRLIGASDKPMLVVFHGLEGSSQRPYALNLMAEVQRRGWRGLVPHFRGCSGELNRLPRAYHSGDAAEIDWILRRAKAEAPHLPLYVAGNGWANKAAAQAASWPQRLQSRRRLTSPPRAMPWLTASAESTRTISWQR